MELGEQVADGFDEFAKGAVAPVRQAHIEHRAHGRLGLGAPDWSAHADVLAIRLRQQPAQQHGRVVENECSRREAAEPLDDDLGDGRRFHVGAGRLRHWILSGELPTNGKKLLQTALLSELPFDVGNQILPLVIHLVLRNEK